MMFITDIFKPLNVVTVYRAAYNTDNYINRLKNNNIKVLHTFHMKILQISKVKMDRFIKFFCIMK